MYVFPAEKIDVSISLKSKKDVSQPALATNRDSDIQTRENPPGRKEKNLRVDNRRKDVDAHVLHGNHIRRRGGRTRTSTQHDIRQFRVSGVTNDAHGQGSTDEEDAEPQVHHLEGGFDIDSWAFGLGGDHGDILGPDDGEQGRRQGGQKAFEASQVPSGDVFAKSRAVVEMSKPVGVTARVPSDHGDEGEEEKGEDQDDLAARQPEFGFTICSNSQDIDRAAVTKR